MDNIWNHIWKAKIEQNSKMVSESILAKQLVEKLLFEVICKIRHMCQKSQKIVFFLKSIFGALPKVMDKIWNHIRKAKIEQNSKMVSESILAKKLAEKLLFENICKIRYVRSSSSTDKPQYLGFRIRFLAV